MKTTWTGILVVLVLMVFVFIAIPGIDSGFGVGEGGTRSVSASEGQKWSYVLYYGGDAVNRSFEIENYLVFRTNRNDSSVTITILNMGDTYDNGTPINRTGWYFDFTLLYHTNETPAIGTDGHLGTFTKGTILDNFAGQKYVPYRLVIKVHVPKGLVLGREYKIGLSVMDTAEAAGSPEEPGVSGSATFARSFNYVMSITPTVSYYIQGTVYEEDGSLADGAKVTIANEDTGDKITVETREDGSYEYDLFQLPLGYSNYDNITVTAEKGKARGTNKTQVQIPAERYAIGSEFSSTCDIHLKAPEEKPQFDTMYIALIVLVVLVVIFGAFAFKRRGKSDKPSEKAKEKDNKEGGDEE